MASGCTAANIGTHFVFADSCCATPFVPTCCSCVSGTQLRGAGVALFVFLEEDSDAMLESADACGVGLAVVSGEVVESTNYILKKGYNGHSSRGGGAGKSAVEREGMVVHQVWEW